MDDALEVTEVTELNVYEVKEREYARKAEVDEERKETRLQRLKDQLAATKDGEIAELREEIKELETRIRELTEFKPGFGYRTRSTSG